MLCCMQLELPVPEAGSQHQIKWLQSSMTGWVSKLQIACARQEDHVRLTSCSPHKPLCPTCSKGGCGLPRQKLDSVQVAFRSMDSLLPSLSWSSRGCSAPAPSTWSLHFGESPAMLPSAHTACREVGREAHGQTRLSKHLATYSLYTIQAGVKTASELGCMVAPTCKYHL